MVQQKVCELPDHYNCWKFQWLFHGGIDVRENRVTRVAEAKDADREGQTYEVDHWPDRVETYLVHGSNP